LFALGRLQIWPERSALERGHDVVFGGQRFHSHQSINPELSIVKSTAPKKSPVLKKTTEMNKE
jgi:hypothetical protein